MNREILFKANRKDSQEWVYGYLVKENEKYYITENTDTFYEVVPETVSQYIERLDKNKKMIFEGCKCKECINRDFSIYLEGIVEYLDDRYILRYDDKSYAEFMFIKSDDIEVIDDKEVK